MFARSWAEGLSDRAAWVQVERGERDGQRFWLSVIGALSRAVNEIQRIEPAPSGVVREGIDAFYESTEVLQPEDIADGIAFMVTRPRRASISELCVMPPRQA